MIDRAARDRYAVIIRDFRDARIDNRQYEGRFEDRPISESRDRAIAAIYSMLWYTYCDIRKHKQEGGYALTSEGKALYNRCIAFLESDEEYVWPMGNFVAPFFKVMTYLIGFVVGFGVAGYWLFPVMGVRELGAIVAAPLGFFCFLVWFLVQRRRNLKAAADSPFDGDMEAWPFTSKEALARYSERRPPEPMPTQDVSS